MPELAVRETPPMPDLFTPLIPFAIRVGQDDIDVILKCPECGNIDSIEYYDCCGADEDCVFCNECSQELRLP